MLSAIIIIKEEIFVWTPLNWFASSQHVTWSALSTLKCSQDRELEKVVSTRQQYILRFFSGTNFMSGCYSWTPSFSLFSFYNFFFQERTAVLMSRSLGSGVGWSAPCLLPSFAPESCELLMPIERKDGTWDSFSRQSYHIGGWIQL